MPIQNVMGCCVNNNNKLANKPSIAVSKSYSQRQKIEVELEVQIGDEVFKAPIEVEVVVNDDGDSELHFDVGTDFDVEAFKMPDVGFESEPDSELATFLANMAEVRENMKIFPFGNHFPKQIYARMASKWKEQTEVVMEMAAKMVSQSSHAKQKAIPLFPLVDSGGFIG